MADINFIDGDVIFNDGDIVWSRTTSIPLLPNTNYTINFKVLTSAPNASTTPEIGGVEGVTVYGDGWFTENIISPNATSTLSFLATNSTVSDITVFAEGDITSVEQYTELNNVWQHLMILFATFLGLMRDKRQAAASMIYSMYSNELEYFKSLVVEIIIDSKNDVRYQ